jgi:hypothetical protein
MIRLPSIDTNIMEKGESQAKVLFHSSLMLFPMHRSQEKSLTVSDLLRLRVLPTERRTRVSFRRALVWGRVCEAKVGARLDRRVRDRQRSVPAALKWGSAPASQRAFGCRACGRRRRRPLSPRLCRLHLSSGLLNRGCDCCGGLWH